jgi:hypothetical protein
MKGCMYICVVSFHYLSLYINHDIVQVPYDVSSGHISMKANNVYFFYIFELLNAITLLPEHVVEPSTVAALIVGPSNRSTEYRPSALG